MARGPAGIRYSTLEIMQLGHSPKFLRDGEVKNCREAGFGSIGTSRIKEGHDI